MKLISFKNRKYPEHQALGNAAQFAIPYAKYYCRGVGYDIGCKKKEWAFPGAVAIDIEFNDSYHAMNLPLDDQVDYIFSSHCLEHLDRWVDVLDYWYLQLKLGGILFLYLPHFDQEYWRPWNNRSHRHVLTPDVIVNWMVHNGFVNIFVGERDLNYSFMVVGEKN